MTTHDRVSEPHKPPAGQFLVVVDIQTDDNESADAPSRVVQAYWGWVDSRGQCRLIELSPGSATWAQLTF